MLDVEFPARYGGNIRVFLGSSIEACSSDLPEHHDLSVGEGRFIDQFALLKCNIKHWRERKRRFLDQLVCEHGRLPAKAFPGRAAILVKLLGINEEWISAVHEKPGSLKIGHYVPGTRIPIVSDESLFEGSDNGTPLLNLAWHIPDEIRSYLAEHDYTGPIIDVLGVEDFSVAS